MIKIMSQVTNPAAPWSTIPDTLDNILQDLEEYALDPVFELYGDFVNPAPEWISQDAAEKYSGCTLIYGNFRELSHAFNLVTDEPEIINRLRDAIDENRKRPDYQQARKKALAKVPPLSKETARIGEKYMIGNVVTKLTRIYTMTEQEAREKQLVYLDRFEGVNRFGPTGGAMPDSATIELD